MQSSFLSIEHKRSGGFTLIELLIVVIVAGILLSVGVPSLRAFVLNQRIKNATFDVVAALTFARSEAIKRNVPVEMILQDQVWTVQVAGQTTALRVWGPYSGLSFGGATSITYSNLGRSEAADISLVVDGGADARCVSVSLSGRPNTRTGGCT